MEGIVNLIDLKHESSLIFKDCWEPCRNAISVHEPSPHHHLNERTDVFPNLSRSWNALPSTPTGRPIARDTTRFELLPLLMIYQYLSFKKHRSSKTLAKWNTIILKIYSLGNKYNTRATHVCKITKQRLLGLFFLSKTIVFQWGLGSQFIFGSSSKFWNWILDWDLQMSAFDPYPKDSSFDWSKTKWKKKKKTSDLGEEGSLFISKL